MKNIIKTLICISMIISLILVSGCTTDKFTVAVDYDNNQGEVSGLGEYEAGESVTLIANPNEGYQFVSWMYDGVEVSKSEHYSFSVAKDIELQAVFREVKLNVVTLYNSQHGTVIGAGEYKYGDEVTVSVTENDWYEFSHFEINNEKIYQEEITFEIKEGTIVKALFERKDDILIFQTDSSEGGRTSISNMHHF